MLNVLIVAGGLGRRLWPASTQKNPKQFLPLLGNQTLLQTTCARFQNRWPQSRIFLATAGRYLPAVKKQLPQIPKKNFSIEPVPRGRAAAVGLAALIIAKQDPEGCFATVWSDHYIKNAALYQKTLLSAEKYLQKHPGCVAAIGVKPESPHSGYGYIRLGQKLKNQRGPALFAARGFKEKPSPAVAEKYLKSGAYLWNTGCFIWQTRTLLSLYRKHLPKIYNLLMKIQPFIGTAKQQWAINKFYPKMPAVDLEAGLIEKLSDVAALEGRFGWADIGDWAGLKQALLPGQKNLCLGPQFNLNTQDSLIYNYTQTPVATLGLKGLVLVITKDAILAADKSQAPNLKTLLKIIEKNPRFKSFA